MHEHDKPIRPTSEETPQASPEEGLPQVAEVGGKRQKIVGVMLMALLLFLVVGLRHCHPTDESMTKPTETTTEKPDYHGVHDNTTLNPASPRANPVKAVQTDPAVLKMQLALQAERAKVYRMRQSAPIELFKSDKAVNRTATVQTPTTESMHRLPLSQQQINALRQANSPDEDFSHRVEQSTVVRAEATHIPYRADTITQGTLVLGVLQTAINSDLPGMIKANVSEDVYGSTGQKLLIPKGSTLIGQYNSGMVLGQKRVMVMWSRLIRPDGVDVMLGSPSTDSLGASGMGANVLETHFWERFGQASLLSIISAGIANVGVNEDEGYNSASEYRMMLSSNFQSTANSALLATMSQKPTIHIFQGSKINVFVNRDISFHDVNEGDA